MNLSAYQYMAAKGQMTKGKAPKKLKAPPLPDELIFLPNDDKAFHEEWSPGRNMLNFPHPWRMLLAGPPNVGKSTLCKNVLLRADPPFERVLVVHCDAKNTKEYDDVDGEMTDAIPNPDDWEGTMKTLVILDDLEFKQMPAAQKGNLDRLVGYASTHRNLSVCICVQDAFSLPVIVRRCSNIFCLWKGIDIDSMKQLARKVGMNQKDFTKLLDTYATGDRTSMWFDQTSKTPYPLRRNGFEVIEPADSLRMVSGGK